VSDDLVPHDIEDVRGFGRSARSKIKAKYGVTMLGELAKRRKGELCGIEDWRDILEDCAVSTTLKSRKKPPTL
jgi:hypothetical protein